MAKIWDDEGPVSEYDLISEDAQKAEELAEEYTSRPDIVQADEGDLEDIAEESTFDLTTNESNIIYNARLRLEQAKLYELLINHNLFEGVDASPDAIKNVQNELKFYIVKRLEILLGLREQVIRTESTVAPELPFNEVEVDFLKQLAFKGTFGKSSEEQAKPVAAKPQAIKPAASAGLNSLKMKPVTPAAPAPKATVRQNTTVQQPAPQQKAVVKKQPPAQTKAAAAPQAPKIKASGLGRDLSKEEAEAIARADLKTASKPFHEMTAKEKAVRIREANERNKRPVAASGAAPMPSENELHMKYVVQQQNRGGSRNQSDQFNVMLANALAAKKNQGDLDE
jgi:hypothetical protein